MLEMRFVRGDGLLGPACHGASFSLAPNAVVMAKAVQGDVRLHQQGHREQEVAR